VSGIHSDEGYSSNKNHVEGGDKMESYEKEYFEKHPKSKIAWEKAKEFMPLGVGSPIWPYDVP
jgi:hypothetical protein